MLRSILRLRSIDLGFRPDNVLVVRLSALPGTKYDSGAKMENFYESLLDKVMSFPGVRSAGFSSSPPLLTPNPSVPFLVRGRSDLSPKHPPTAQYIVVSHGYFSALSIPLLQGRGIERSDSSTTEPVVVINEAMSKQYWPGQNPIGQFLNIFDGAEAPKQIIGVVSNVRDSSVSTASTPEMYVPYTQVPAMFISLLKSFPPALAVQATGGVEPVSNAVRNMVAEIDPNEAVLSAAALESIVSESVAQPRLYSQVLEMFAAIALILAALGIYGVVSYSVTERTQELGVRMALGAPRNKILLLVLGQSMFFTLIGVALGIGGALALTGVLRSLLFEIRPHDPVTIVVATIILAIVAFIAAYLPARRASLIDPNSALRL
jgi:putative ABC transport system permease protein